MIRISDFIFLDFDSDFRFRERILWIRGLNSDSYSEVQISEFGFGFRGPNLEERNSGSGLNSDSDSEVQIWGSVIQGQGAYFLDPRSEFGFGCTRRVLGFLVIEYLYKEC